MRVLAMDTSTEAMSIALIEENDVKMELNTYTKIKHSKQLLPLIQAACRAINWSISSVEAIAVTRGPGSYTGLRIGVTTAKVLAKELRVPLYSVGSLEALAVNVKEDGPVFPFLNARRQTVFLAGYQKGEAWQTLLPVGHYTLEDWLDTIDEAFPTGPLYFVSPDASLFEAAIQEKWGERAKILAKEGSHLAAHRLLEAPFREEDADIFVPEYAKLAEAEEKWQASHPDQVAAHHGSYVERAD